MKFGFVIPIYNHGSALESVVQNLIEYNYPIVLVDDGNDQKNKDFIHAVNQKYSSTVLVTCEKNGGKGKAMIAGVKKADEIGITHVFQIDSDGQHDASKISLFLEESKKNPDAIICGYPEYDENAPKKRVNGRRIANAWIHIVTLSNVIKDALIGFRIYPVKPYMKIINHHVYIDSRMAYAIDILVHLFWLGVSVISEPVKVIYPVDGVSNFRVVRDNVRISFTYAKLCLGMIVRIPVLLYRKIKKS